MVEAEGGAVSSLYPQCILTVSSLYPSKERCLRRRKVVAGGGSDGGGWQRRRVAEYDTVSSLYPHCILTVSLQREAVNGDDPIFVILTRNKFALKHVSLMHMSNETKTKAVLFQQYIFGMVLKQKNAAQTIGKQVFNSLNISGVRKCKY